jgi:putative ribosome biogenesis GTPase RsgA
MNPARSFNEFCHTCGGRIIVLLAIALCVWEPSAHAQSKAAPHDKPRPRRITIENLITAAALPADYQISREVFLNGEKIVGDKLMLTRDEAVSKVIVQIENRKLATRHERAAAAKDYVLGVMQSFHEAGLKAVEKQLPELEKNDFKKRTLADFIYKRPADGSRLFVQLQVFFTDRGYTVLVISDNEQDHAHLTHWARSVLPK